ncbi:hypothetical protein B0H13DRAFT_1883439 [Mycena leptocephala]|nr:hypothetical protein B0H13DRAFT_1883439 [Mycena leptocephala]
MPEGPEQNPVPNRHSVLDPVNISANGWSSSAAFHNPMQSPGESFTAGTVDNASYSEVSPTRWMSGLGCLAAHLANLRVRAQHHQLREQTNSPMEVHLQID